MPADTGVPQPMTLPGGPVSALSPFVLEWFAANKPSNQIPISSVCNCHCLFCSNALNPFPIVSGVFRDLEDIKLQLCAMAANDDPIRLSDSLPGRISEGEALLHPKLFEIFDAVRKKFFYNTLCFTTNGCLLDGAFLRRLAAYRPIEITVSMHTTQPRLWAEIFRKREKDAETAIAALPAIGRFGMELVGTIVPLPRLCGWDDLERTYEYFIVNGAKSMILYWPGHSLRMPEQTVRDLACPLEEFTAYAQRMKSRFNAPLDALPDMAAALPVSVETLVVKTLNGNPKSRGGPYRRVVWLASRAAFERLERMVAEAAAGAANEHAVAVADNLTYKGNIIASGLLMADDFVAAGRAALDRWPGADLFLVPSNPFDSLLRDLKGVPAYKIAEALGRPVWIAQNDGVIDAQLSARIVSRRKPADIGPRQAMEVYNGERGGPGDAVLADRRFEWLDASRALCIESYLPRNGSKPFNRWVWLTKREGQWAVERVERGNAE